MTSVCPDPPVGGRARREDAVAVHGDPVMVEIGPVNGPSSPLSRPSTSKKTLWRTPRVRTVTSWVEDATEMPRSSSLVSSVRVGSLFTHRAVRTGTTNRAVSSM